MSGIMLGRFHVRLWWEPRDLWVGLYVKKPWWEGGRFTHQVFLCLLPTVVLAIDWLDPA